MIKPLAHLKNDLAAKAGPPNASIALRFPKPETASQSDQAPVVPRIQAHLERLTTRNDGSHVHRQLLKHDTVSQSGIGGRVLCRVPDIAAPTGKCMCMRME